MTHRDRAGDPSGQRAGRREAAGDAGHRQGFPTPSPIRPLPVRLRDRNGGFPRLSDGPWLSDGAHGLRCLASPRQALPAESLGKPSLWVIINAPWYESCGRCVGSLDLLPAPGQEFVEALEWMFDVAGENVAEPGLRIDGAHLRGDDQRVHERGSVTTSRTDPRRRAITGAAIPSSPISA